MNTQTEIRPRIRRLGEPVTPGSERLRELFAAIGEGAFERERDDVPPYGAFHLVREYGFGAFRVARELGGGGATLPQLVEALIELAAVDPNVAHALRSHFIFVDARLGPFARGEDPKWLAEVLSGAIFGNATTELGNRNTGGLEAGRFQTTIVPSGDGYLLNGSKYYSTGSLYSDWVPVVAVAPDESVVTAIVPADRKGVTLEDDWDGIGQRLTASGSSRFEDVWVAPDELVVSQTRSHAGGYSGTLAQLHLTAVIAGILDAVVRDAVTVLRGRARTFSHGAAATAPEDPLLQHLIGQLAANAYSARAVVLAAAASLERAADTTGADGSVDPELLERAKLDSAMAKVTVDELAGPSGWQLFDVAGASATRAGRNLDRHWRNARTLASHNPAIYKTRALGDHLINGGALPASALF